MLILLFFSTLCSLNLHLHLCILFEQTMSLRDGLSLYTSCGFDRAEVVWQHKQCKLLNPRHSVRVAPVASALDRCFRQVVTNVCKGRLSCPKINSSSSKMAKITCVWTKRVSRGWELAAHNPKLHGNQLCARMSSLCHSP